MKVELRAATPADDPFLAELDAEVHAGEFAAAGLPPDALAPLLAMQHRARTLGYASQFPHAENSIVWIGPHRVGRVLVNASEDELRLVDVALLAAYRGSGIGAGLLKDVIARARSFNVPLRLSVRTGNPAARLYARLGLVATAADAMYTEMELTAAEPTGPLKAQVEAAGTVELVSREASSAYFRWLNGKTIEARCIDGNTAELMVTAVTTARAAQPQVDANDSFTVTFRGPLVPVFTQALCEIRETGAEAADTMAGHGSDPMLLALVPLGPDEGGMRYEAVFNRMQWKPTTP